MAMSRPFQQRNRNTPQNVGPAIKFLKPDYVTPNVVLSADRSMAQRVSPGPCNETIVFVDTELSGTIGATISLKVAAVSRSSLQQNMVFGLSTCSLTAIRQDSVHAVCPCSPQLGCGGNALIQPISGLGLNDTVTIEWTGNYMNVKGKEIIKRRDYENLFRDGKKAVPFIILNGSVSSIQLAAVISKPKHGRFMGNDCVSFDAFLLSRTPQSNVHQPCYIFRDTPLNKKDVICFEFDDVVGVRTIRFGLTTKKPEDILIPSLAVDAMNQSTRDPANWFAVSIPAIKGHKVRITKNDSVVSYCINPQRDFSEEVNALNIGTNKFVYAFFNFLDGVKSIRLLTNNLGYIVQPRNPPQNTPAPTARKTQNASADSLPKDCMVCHDADRIIMCVPCNHIVYCEDCKQDAVDANMTRCPYCNTNVSSYTRVYL